jgi:hypothetical protein
MSNSNKRIFKLSLLLLLFSILVPYFLNLFQTEDIYAANVLTNPSFTGGTTGWTLSSMTYDSTNYQDSAGSVHAYAGRKASVTGTATHTSYTSINSYDTVNLSGYWMITIGGNGSATLYIEVENQSNPGSWTTIWNTTLQSTASSWTAINTDVSSNFGTGSYRIRIRAQLDGGAAAGAGIDVWFDNMNLDVVTPTVTVGTTGTQTSTVSPSTTDFYVGGAFTLVRNLTSTTVSSITINETGTIADTDISGLILYYKQEATCSTSIPVDATQFNATPGTFTSGSSTVTGSMSVGTSQICMYVEVDIGSGASVDETVEIQITNPSTGVTASSGTVSPSTAVAISGTTTIVEQTSTLSIDIVDGTNSPVTSPSVSMNSSVFNFVNQSTTGTLGTASEKIFITSDSTTNWEVSIAATTGATALWSNSGNTIYYDFNDSTANAEDGADTDSYGGQLTINPSVATLSAGSGCSTTGLSLGSNASFIEDSVNAITLLSASSADSNCDWSLTDIDLTQTIPAEQPSDAYGIDLTLTITAI